jgi:hypothetical protein
MEKASEVVLERIKSRDRPLVTAVARIEGHTPDKIIRYPNRYMDEDRGRAFFEEVVSLL